MSKYKEDNSNNNFLFVWRLYWVYLHLQNDMLESP